MKTYDVIIVGAGPAGLICAEKLAGSGLSILLVEKDTVFGDKVCAGGLTRKDLSIYEFPDELIARKVCKTAVHSPRRLSQAETPEPIVITMDRKDLGRFQRSRLEGSDVEVISGSRVKEVKDGGVITSDNQEFGYTYLVGADGYASVVRRYLNIPVKRKLIGIQYVVPMQNDDPKLEIFLDNRYFHAWYGWIFPHRDVMSVGCCCDARFLSAAKLKENFHRWLDKKGIDISKGEYQSAPISYDFRGLRFNNIFLVGEAAGIASGLTGEGIYQSLVSGIEVAEYIKGREEESEQMRFVRKYNLIQLRTMKFLIYCGPLRGMIHELIIMLLNNKRFKAKINKGFS